MNVEKTCVIKICWVSSVGEGLPVLERQAENLNLMSIPLINRIDA